MLGNKLETVTVNEDLVSQNTDPLIYKFFTSGVLIPVLGYRAVKLDSCETRYFHSYKFINSISFRFAKYSKPTLTTRLIAIT